MLNIAVLVSGSGSNLQAIIDEKLKGNLNNVNISCVVSNKTGVFALERAENQGIDNKVFLKKEYEDQSAWEDALISYLKDKNVDLVVLAGFLTILSEKFVESFTNSIINIHPSLIPAFCGDGFYGLNVHKAAIEKGVKISGATVHYVDAGVDTGKIIMQKAVDVLDNDTPETLQKRVLEEAEWVILPLAIKKIADDRNK